MGNKYRNHAGRSLGSGGLDVAVTGPTELRRLHILALSLISKVSASHKASFILRPTLSGRHDAPQDVLSGRTPEAFVTFCNGISTIQQWPQGPDSIQFR
jgi:hypothetical protein